MGGWGSGPAVRSQRDFIEREIRFDVKHLSGLVRGVQPIVRALTFARNGEVTAVLWVIADDSSACVLVGDKVHRASITWTPVHFGGERAWLVCPDCGKRRYALVVKPCGLSCRECLRLDHFSHRESPHDRAFRRARRVREKVGDRSGNLARRFPSKPKGMWTRTYLRHLSAYNRAMNTVVENEVAWLERVKARFAV